MNMQQGWEELCTDFTLTMAAQQKRIATLEALVKQQDAILAKRPCQNSRCNELNAARALLREVLEDGYLSETKTHRIASYLDACDKPGEPT